MSKPLTWDKSKDDKRRRGPDGSGSSKMSKPAPTNTQRKQKKRGEAWQKAADSIWRQGKGGS
mgnify:CR=1 FL=1